ncbi:hypothetical protein evm_015086 [Chilo suppressalis]|nr:hypothetical protein evm_015086 [Chilo suppressalis]
MLIWYGALDESLGPEASRLWVEGGALLGHTPQMDHFRVTLVPQKGKIIHSAYSEAHAPGLHVLKEKFYSLLKVQKHPGYGRMAVVGPDEELDEKCLPGLHVLKGQFYSLLKVQKHPGYGRMAVVGPDEELDEKGHEQCLPGLHVLKGQFYSLLKVQKHPGYGRMAVVGPDEELDEKVKAVVGSDEELDEKVKFP